MLCSINNRTWQFTAKLLCYNLKKNYHFVCVKNYLIFDSCVNNVLPLGKLLPLILKLNDQYLYITGKYQYDVLLSLCKQNSGVFLPSIRLSCRKSKCR